MVQLRQRFFEHDDGMVRAGNIARAARACAEPADGFGHGGDDFRMLAHAEVIVAAPHGDRAPRDMAFGERKRPGLALEVVEHAVAAFALKLRNAFLEKVFVVDHNHRNNVTAEANSTSASP